jgi:cytochrome-b5 reductase
MTDFESQVRVEPTTENPRKTKVLMTEFVTHDVKRFVIEKPTGYEFIPGQANLVALDKEEWRDEFRPFTFTSLNEDLVLEFTIKGYPEHEGVTDRLHHLKAGDEIVLHDPFGTIVYQSSGYFLAAGAGVTPFIAITRHLREHNKLADNSLIFSNKRAEDIILEKEFRDMFGDDLVLTLTDEKKSGYEHGRIDKDFLADRIDTDKYFYICGPDGFVKDLKKALESLGVHEERIVVEKLIFM